MNRLKLLKRFLLTRNCIICNEPVSYSDKIPFCEECSEHWTALKNLKCHRCGRKSEECTCLPSQIRECSRHGAAWCVFYDKNSKLIANNLVFKLKREYNKDIISFFADEMTKNLKSLLFSHGIDYKSCIVTYAPRRLSGKFDYGFDHSKELAKYISKNLGVELRKTLVNKGKKAQKNLSKSDRVENARQSYFPRNKIDVSGKTVIFVDDIITSGSTIKACADILYILGAKDVIPVAFAKDNR